MNARFAFFVANSCSVVKMLMGMSKKYNEFESHSGLMEMNNDSAFKYNAKFIWFPVVLFIYFFLFFFIILLALEVPSFHMFIRSFVFMFIIYLLSTHHSPYSLRNRNYYLLLIFCHYSFAKQTYGQAHLGFLCSI